MGAQQPVDGLSVIPDRVLKDIGQPFGPSGIHRLENFVPSCGSGIDLADELIGHGFAAHCPVFPLTRAGPSLQKWSSGLASTCLNNGI